MATPPFKAGERTNLAQADLLLADASPEGLEVLIQMFAGFGVHMPHCAATAEEAMTKMAERELHLIVADVSLPDQDGYDLVRWLRRSGPAINRTTAVILLSGHTRSSDVARARDCGANFVIRKPVVPLVMLQRVVWVSRESRDFIEAEGYCGPDRRVRALGPPMGTKGRRKDDLSLDVGAATTPNLDQDDIDAMFQPKRATL
jgi:CheY-like chemotaxis protein